MEYRTKEPENQSILQRFGRWLSLKQYQIEVTFGVYMFTPTEKFIFCTLHCWSGKDLYRLRNLVIGFLFFYPFLVLGYPSMISISERCLVSSLLAMCCPSSLSSLSQRDDDTTDN